MPISLELSHFHVDLGSWYVIAFLIGSACSVMWSAFLSWKNRDYVLKNESTALGRILSIHPCAKGFFTQEKLDSSLLYERTCSAFFVFRNRFFCTVTSGALIFGIMPWVFTVFFSGFGFGIAASLFMTYAVFSAIMTLLGIPFSWYSIFNIESKFGFNTSTPRIFWKDRIKSFICDIVLTGCIIFLLSYGAEIYMRTFPASSPDEFIRFDLLTCALCTAGYSAAGFIMEAVEIYVITPLFNKFTPLSKGRLKDRITALLRESGFRSGGIYVMNASIRSKHSNAYCTGWGRCKRIVLYDTLLDRFSDDEILAIVGHELGHAKLHHLAVSRFYDAVSVFVMLYFISLFANDPGVLISFGWVCATTIPAAKLILVSVYLLASVYGKFSWLLTGIWNRFSRKCEFEADTYACVKLGSAEPLITALFKLYGENLSYPINDPFFENWYFSHPGLINRVEALKRTAV